jgi:hypothetical protein
MSKLIWTIHIASDQYRIFKAKKNIENLVDLMKISKSGSTFGELWKPIEMEFYGGEKTEVEIERTKPVGDFVQGIVTEAVSAKARHIIEPITMKDVEFLPLNTEMGFYYELNVKQVDCLDISNSIVKRFESSGRVMSVIKYRWLEDKLNGINIFRIPELRTSLTFVSDVFKSTVESNNLTGLFFKQVPMSE